jgi:quercetin dioxygenase-like cupin family protein
MRDSVGVTLGEFFDGMAAAGPAIIRRAERQSLQSDWSRATIEALTPRNPDSWLEAVLITLRPGGASGSRLHAQGTEILALVFEGEVLLTLGDAAQSLEKGDAVMIPASTPHRWSNRSARAAKILKVTPRVL